jgi:transcriptional regulator with XRE-family HTH domain
VSHLTSIKTKISEKLGDAEYRKRFFRGQAEDEIAMSIKALREKRKKRQVDLAKDSGMKQSAVSRIEQADYRGWSLKTLFRVADALDARLRIIFEPSETVIEHYRELEAGTFEQGMKKQMEEKKVQNSD